jgi:DNA-binding NarL/FixJ family response regulator
VQQNPPPIEGLDPPDALTAREAEVLRLMAGGYSNREIAEALGTAEGTVKNQASVILSKLGVRDRTRAVLKAGAGLDLAVPDLEGAKVLVPGASPDDGQLL